MVSHGGGSKNILHIVANKNNLLTLNLSPNNIVDIFMQNKTSAAREYVEKLCGGAVTTLGRNQAMASLIGSVFGADNSDLDIDDNSDLDIDEDSSVSNPPPRKRNKTAAGVNPVNFSTSQPVLMGSNRNSFYHNQRGGNSSAGSSSQGQNNDTNSNNTGNRPTDSSSQSSNNNRKSMKRFRQ
ncbi:MAG: hypothetical protein KIT27_08560, partial [Legionellales bacterium]|nr:hypothetical protein [Legionellales bacterium]